MANEYVVSFSESISQLAEFQLRMRGLGTALDTLEQKGQKGASASAQVINDMQKAYTKLEEALKSVGTDTNKINGTMTALREETAKMFSGIAAQNLKATAAQAAYNGELGVLGKLMNDTASKNGFVRTMQQIEQLTNKTANDNRLLIATIAHLGTEEAQLTIKLKEQRDALINSLKSKKENATAEEKLAQSTAKLRAEIDSLHSVEAQENLLLQQIVRSKKAEITENQRLDTQLQQLERTLVSLNGGMAQQIAEAQALINARKGEITEDQRATTTLERLKRELASLNGGMAEQIVKTQQLINARKKQITDAEKVTLVESEARKAIQAEKDALAKLQAQLQLMSGPRGRQITQLREQIVEQQRLNAISQRSTLSLLGFSSAQGRLTLSQQAGSQSAAMLRAGLQGLNASVGMYTSGTILAATATYGIARALRDSVETGAQFEATMSRARAVMSTNGPSWMKDTGLQSEALELQVRALGQTTVFTASEVAKGLQALGQAGLGSSDALTALAPTLSLANIANVSMAESADMATNILATFGMQAKDLAGVVDLMATAVNNSNTDMKELANALTYAGPAAHTAGISIQDTTSAIETLANAGIKGSRSGSALRRLFVSLLNPTKKGSEVIKKYGLDILDAAGNTRSLTEIINQMNKAFKDLPGGERLAAIQNLVGVYATSPVASLVNNAEQNQRFSDQNVNVKGAATKMEAIISDNLLFDWKAMLSALEELQLTAFDSMSDKLRVQVAQLSTWVLDQMKPVEEGGDITGLDRIMQQAITGAQALGQLVIGIVAYKFATGSVFGALAMDSKKAANNLTEVAARTRITSTGLLMMGSSADGARTRMDLMNAAAGRSVGALSSAATAGAFFARTLNTMAAAGAGLMRAFGWVGLVYGVYSAVSILWSSDTDKQIQEHRDSVDEVKSSYQALKEAIEESGLAKQRAALSLQIKADESSVVQVKDRIKDSQKLLTTGERAGFTSEQLKPLQDDIASLESLVGTYEGKVRDSEKALGALGNTTNDYLTDLDLYKKAIQDAANLTNDLTLAKANLNVAMASGNTSTGVDFGASGVTDANSQRMLVARLEQDLIIARERVAQGRTKTDNTLSNIPSLRDRFATDEAERLEAVRLENYKKLTPEAQKLLDVEQAITKESSLREDLMKRDEEAIRTNSPRPGADIEKQSNTRLTELEAQKNELQEKVTAQNDALAKAREEATRVTRSDAENLLELTKQRADIEQQIKAAAASGLDKTDPEKVTALYVKQRDVLQQLKGLEKKDQKADDKEGKEAARLLKEAQSQYDGLAKKFDAVTYSQREFEKGTTAMNRLRAAELITAEQENKALGELNLQRYEAVQALDKNYIAMEKLRDSYSGSEFGTAANDLALLNQNLQTGIVSLEEYNRVYFQIRKKQMDQATAGLPDADISPGDFSGTVFTDLVEKVDQTSTGNKAFDQRQKDLENSLEIQMAANERERDMAMEQLEAKKLMAEENAKQLLEIEERYQSQKTGIQLTAAQQQNAVTEKSAKFQQEMGQVILAGALGTAANILGQFASASAEATTAQKVAFAAQKALAVAQIIIYTEVAAARATGEMPFGMGIAMSSFIRGVGYANAGLVAGLAIGELSGGGSSSSSSSSTPMYDTGGYIPYNRVGIVGEYGPELVTGPASVKGRTATESAMRGGSGSGELHVTIAPQIIIQGGAGDTSGGQNDAKNVASTVKLLVVEKVQDMIRPGGLLYEWKRNNG